MVFQIIVLLPIGEKEVLMSKGFSSPALHSMGEEEVFISKEFFPFLPCFLLVKRPRGSVHEQRVSPYCLASH